MIVIDRNAPWIQELAWLAAILAELGHERAAIIAREYLHSMIVALNDEQETSIVVECQASREVELTISFALFLGADRELDSSITIKSIASHLSLPIQSNLSRSLTKRQRDDLKLQLANPRDEDVELTHTRHETRERDRPSNEQRTNKNQSMKERRTAPLSLIPPSSHTRASSS